MADLRHGTTLSEVNRRVAAHSEVNRRVATQSEVATLWLRALCAMPPPLLAKCLTVHTLEVPDGSALSARPAVRVTLPGAQAGHPPHDFTEVLLDILQLLVSNHAKHVHVRVHGLVRAPLP